MTLYLHIGLHKTGTSSLQEFLKRNAPVLAEHGYAYPAAGWVGGAHHNPAYELLGKPRFDPAAGTLADSLRATDAAPNAILSSEEFEFLGIGQVKALREAIGERPTRIILYLRRQDALIASTFAQQVRMGARMHGFRHYVVASLYAARFDFPQLVGRWAHIFGRENIDVAVISPETSGPLLFDDFLGRVGLGDVAQRFPKLARSLNETPGWAQVELIRRVRFASRNRGPLPPEQLKEIAAAAAEAVSVEPRLAKAGRLRLNAAQWARVAARYGAGNAKVAADYVSSPVQAAALAFAPAPTGHLPGPSERLLRASAAELIARLAPPAEVQDAAEDAAEAGEGAA